MSDVSARILRSGEFEMFGSLMIRNCRLLKEKTDYAIRVLKVHNQVHNIIMHLIPVYIKSVITKGIAKTFTPYSHYVLKI